MARNIFNRCAPDLYYRPSDCDCPPVHILFLGFTALTRELILQTALTAHYPDFRLPRVTILCQENNRELAQRFSHRYPQLSQTLQINVIYADPLTIVGERWREMQEQTYFTVCYVAMEKDVEGILASRRLNRLSRIENLPKLNIVVCLNQQSFVAEIIDDDFLPIHLDKSLLPEHTPVEYFETLDETISIDIVVNESLDTLARTLHNNYLETLRASGESPEDNASLMPWSELPAHKKKANQHAAAHMDIKLRCCGCQAVAVHNETPEAPFPANTGHLEMLAQLEHRRWMADKYLSGYSHGNKRDEDRMFHPDLVPWEQLTEPDKNKDRENIRQIPSLLALQDQKIVLAAEPR